MIIIVNIGFIIIHFLRKNYYNHPNWPDDNLNDLIQEIKKILKDLENRSYEPYKPLFRRGGVLN